MDWYNKHYMYIQANAWILNMMFFLFQFLHMILPVEHYLQDLSDLEYDSR
jgi:hypothetical protein